MAETAWNLRVLPPATTTILDRLSTEVWMKPFYLAGGTGLALQLGHRISADLDFFAGSFDEEALLGLLQRASPVRVVSKARETLHVHINDTKVSFLGYPYPLLFPLDVSHGVAVAEARDIACMKISAIAGRGGRRDFVDLYLTSLRYGLPVLLELFRTKFARVSYSAVHVLKSLAYFDDAEKEPMPNMLVPLAWEEIREYFTTEVKKLAGGL